MRERDQRMKSVVTTAAAAPPTNAMLRSTREAFRIIKQRVPVKYEKKIIA